MVLCAKQAVLMCRVAVLLNFCVLSLSALITETTRPDSGAPPVVPTNLNTNLVAKDGAKQFRIQCPAQGQGLLLVEWTKDGDLIGAGWLRIKLANNDHELRIRNVRKEDAGVYVCKVVNGYGTAYIRYTLKVTDDDDTEDVAPPVQSDREAPPSWQHPKAIAHLVQNPQVRAHGSTYELKCEAAGNPLPDIVWLKDGKKVKEDWNGIWSYRLEQLRDSDSGRYTCKVTNIFGSINATFLLIVSSTDPNSHLAPSAPAWDAPPANSTIVEGQQAAFQCKVKSAVEPTITWVRQVDHPAQAHPNKTFTVNGINYTVLDNYPAKTRRQDEHAWLNELVIPHVAQHHTGWYECVVTNPAGAMIHQKAFLRVLSANEKLPITSGTQLHVIIGVPVAVVLLMAVGYAIYYLKKNQQKHEPMPPASVLNVGALGKNVCAPASNTYRPPPPTQPPPSLPSSTKTAHLTAYYRDPYGNHSPKYYHQLDPHAAVPLNNAYLAERDLYESTPQPYELRYDRNELSDSCSDLAAPRIQHYPSMYSCR